MSEAICAACYGEKPPQDGYEWHEATEVGDTQPRWVRGEPKTEEPRRCDVEIKVKPNGTGSVLIDGHDISNRISKIEFIAQAGECSEVVLYMRAVEVKVMASAFVTHKLLILDPDTAQEVSEEDTAHDS